jgi:hypothetical protein
VKAAKEKLARALMNDEAAWAEYVQEYGAGSVMNLLAGPLTDKLPEQARDNVFKNCFKAALREMDRLNKETEATGYEGVAYGINNHAHLCPQDFAALRTTGLLHGPPPADTRRRGRRAGPAAVAAGKPGPPTPTPRCSSSTGNVPYPTNLMPLKPTPSDNSFSWIGNGVPPDVRD